MNLRRLYNRLRDPRRTDAELDEEVRSFYETMEARRVDEGIAPDEARRTTHAAYGPPDRVKEEVRDSRVEAVFETVFHDLRYALRVLRKNPGFAAVAVLSLGLGLGANTAIFTLVDTVLLKSLPVGDPAHLFFVDNSGGKSGGSSGPPYPCYEILRDQNHYFSGIAAFSPDRFRVTVDGGVQEAIAGQYASGNFFDVVGVGPAIGRVFTPLDDSVPGQGGPEGTAAVISDGLWERRFGRDPSVIGRRILVGTTPATIIGVTRPGFFGLEVGHPTDITVPMMISGANLKSRQSWWFSVVGRLRDGAPVEAARVELDHLFQTYLDDVGMKDRKYFSGIALVPASKGLATLRRQFSRPLQIVMTIVALVLLIGCANVANLLLARASARRHEIAMRLAIGASRSRIVRQLLTEGLLLAGLAAAGGMVLAKLGVSLLVGLFAGLQGRITLEPHFDLRIAAFTALIALLTGLAFSLAPALQATRAGAVQPGTSRASAAGHQIRAGNALVVVQITLSVVLLCGAALFLRTLRNLYVLDAGFDRGGVTLARVDATLPRKQLAPSGPETEAQMSRIGRMWDEFIEPIRTLPTVRAASVSSLSPLDRHDRGIRMTVVGRPAAEGASLLGGPDTDQGIQINHVSAGFFEVFGVTAMAGRVFTAADVSNSPRVAILNESAVRRDFPNESPIGRRVLFPGQRAPGPFEVVGVVRDVRYTDLRKPAAPMVYVPIQQAIDPLRSAAVAVRFTAAIPAIESLLRSRAATAVPGGFVGPVMSLRQQVDESLLQERLLSILATLFGTLALLLATIGLYGVMSFNVIRRTREIGIRLAIGARHGDVMWMILRTTLVLATAGLMLAVPLVWYAKRYIEGQLFGLGTADPVSIGAAAVVLLVAALASGAWPAWRAARLDPVNSLRQE